MARHRVRERFCVVSLSTVLLLCAIGAGVFSGFSARYRRLGTSLADLGLAFISGVLFTVVATVILILAAGLNEFGVLHMLYLAAVVGFPIAAAIIAIPNLLEVEYRTPIRSALLLLVAAGLVGIGVWATHIEPFRLEVDEQVIGIRGADRPVVIGVIADLQTGSIGGHERAALDEILNAEPDAVVVPGDLFQIEESELAARLPEFLGWLRELRRSVDHVLVVNGDVDDPLILEELAEESGVTFLDDAFVQLNLGGQAVTFVGMSVDPEQPRGTLDPELIAALDEATTELDLILAVSHHPDAVLNLEPTTTIDLVISGHTHGGQVSLPGLGPPLTFTDVPQEVAAGGLHVVNGHPIYVSTGVGLERGQAPQVRFGVRPSVGVVTIVPA